MVSAVAKLAVAMGVAQTSLAAPRHRSVRFSYERGSGAGRCPDEAAVRTPSPVFVGAPDDGRLLAEARRALNRVMDDGT